MEVHIQLLDAQLWLLIKNRAITLGGNRKLKIYGTLHCKSGKRLKRENRVFFSGAQEAKAMGYRPCGHCLKHEYSIWKNGSF